MATLYPFDANLVLHDGTSLTSTSVGSVPYYDVGGAFRFPAVAVVNVTALDFTTTDETYDVVIEGSTDSAFTTPNELGSKKILGAGGVGRRTILFDNDQNGVVYEFIRVKFTLGGTTPIISANVYLAPLYPVAA